jgi:hypothetical protein
MPFWLSRAAQNLLRAKRRLIGGQSGDKEGRPPSPDDLTTVILLEPFSYDGEEYLVVPHGGSLHRSSVAHAVLGSEEACLQVLPPEIQMQIFSKLDAKSLCRLAQASKACSTLANDPLVWEPSPCGHCKEVAREQHLRAAEVRALQLEAEERERRRQWQRHKRRVLSLLQASCGMLLVLLPMMLSAAKRQVSARSEATTPALVPPSVKVAAPENGALEQLVWAAVSCRPLGGASY